MQPIVVHSMLILLISGAAFAAEPGDTPPKSSAPPAVHPTDAPVIVYVDVMPACPRRGCWAVTCEALRRLDGVEKVDFEATPSNLRRVYMTEAAGLPDPQRWEAKFVEYAGTSSEFRGVVVTLTGAISERAGGLVVTAHGVDPVRLLIVSRTLRLAEYVASPHAGQPNEPSTDEGGRHATTIRVKVSGTLKKDDTGYSVELRELQVMKTK